MTTAEAGSRPEDQPGSGDRPERGASASSAGTGTEGQGDPEGRGPGLDGVALLYIAGGIPAMVVFFLVLFSLTHACDLPV